VRAGVPQLSQRLGDQVVPIHVVIEVTLHRAEHAPRFGGAQRTTRQQASAADEERFS
jgi:hypothetical protein